MKIKHSEIAPLRLSLLEDQGYCCSLCGDICIEDAVLDHDHKTGLIRAVLHRGCNAMLGKLENNMARNKLDIERLARWAAAVVPYITKTHTDLIHPRHKIKEQTMGRGRGRGRKPPKR